MALLYDIWRIILKYVSGPDNEHDLGFVNRVYIPNIMLVSKSFNKIASELQINYVRDYFMRDNTHNTVKQIVDNLLKRPYRRCYRHLYSDIVIKNYWCNVNEQYP